MTLRGSVAEFPLETVLQLLAATSKTGALEVRAADETGAIGFDKGRLVSATSGDDVGEPALGAIFAISAGEFEFIPWSDAPAANLSGDLDSLLDRAVEQRDRIAADREVITSDRVRFVLSERAAQQGAITLSADQWRALLAVNGERDLTGIAAHLRMGRLVALGMLADLVRAGMIDTAEPPPEPASVPAPAAAPARESSGPSAWDQVAAPAAPVEPAAERAAWPAPASAEPERAAEPQRAAQWDTTPAPRWEAATSAPEPPAPAPSWDTAPPPQAFEPAPPPETREAAPPARSWETATPPQSWETAIPPQSWETAARTEAVGAPAQEWERAEPPRPDGALNDELSARIAALQGTAGSEPEAPPADDRLAALSGVFRIPEAPPAPPPAERDPRLAAFDAVTTEPAVEHRDAAMRADVAASVEAQPEAKKKRGLFGGLFGKREEPRVQAASSAFAASPQTQTRSGQLAAFANALLVEFNGGAYGKGRIDDHMANLLMRVDEQADPIDRPLPIVDDRIDVLALERANVPEGQVAPYLARLVAIVHEDAERTFGKDKAKKGYRAAQQQVFAGDVSALAGPDVAGKLPKV